MDSGGYASSLKNGHILSVKDIEDKIRRAVHLRCARTDEYLKDFDRLRSGFITKGQFERCLDQHYGIVLDAQEERLLLGKYASDPRHPGMVNYRDFCEAIDAAFNPSILNEPPSAQNIGVSVSATIERRPMSPASLAKCDEIIERIAPHYKYHGVNVKTCYEDFDRHNIGVVTESQFYRSFPGPPDVTEEEMRLLAKRYRNPTKQGLCNYLIFHEDVVNTQNMLGKVESQAKPMETTATELSGRRSRQGSSLEEVFDKIRVAVHKNGIRTTEFFKDHDKLRSGIITENQFICGLSLCCGTHANLSRGDIQLLVDYYRTNDGRVRYKEFCDVMENAFNVPHLEKKPTTDVYRPRVGELAKKPNTLSPDKEEKVAEILENLRETVRRKRLMLYPYFKDFDRGKCYTRGITKTQFSRMLHMASLEVPLSSLELLAQKYEYQVGGDINYVAFIQAIDPEFVGTAAPKSDFEEDIERSTTPIETEPDISSVDVQELINRIRHHVLVNRIRVEEYFQDFDPLRHGSISASRFRMGLSSMGQHHLTDAQFYALVNVYSDPKRKGNVLWTKFLVDIDAVFTQRGLEKLPSHKVPPSDTFRMQKQGTKDWSQVAEEKQELFESIMQKMRELANQRRVLVKPCFQDFDRHNNGYVTKSQFCQCITSLGLNSNPDEMSIISEKYTDNTGFNYLRFLKELQPPEKLEDKYTQRLNDLRLTNNKETPDNGDTDIEAIMHKIKTKVVKERIRVSEFMTDYDKLRTGRMLKTTFPRAIDLCALGLTKGEVQRLMEEYAAPHHPGYVNYRRFCDEVESVFTVKDLEKTPLRTVEQFKPAPSGANNKLSTIDAETMLERVMHRLADRVRIRRIQMFPLFEDYDRVHNGSVSRSQFHRVLSELELGSLVSSREFHVLYTKFDVLIGGKHDFNYIAFCDMINEYARFEYGKP